MSRIFQPSFRPVPPLYTWPLPLKRAILTLATIACFGAYIFLIGAILSMVVALALGK